MFWVRANEMQSGMHSAGLLLFHLCIALFFFSHFRCKNWTKFSFFLFNHWKIVFFFLLLNMNFIQRMVGSCILLYAQVSYILLNMKQKYWSYKNVEIFRWTKCSFFRLAKNLNAKTLDYRSSERFWLRFLWG